MEAQALLGLTVAPISRIRKLAGKAAWAGWFVPAVGAMIAPLWAAVGECKLDVKEPRGCVRLAPREPGVPIVRIRHALQLIVAFASGQRGVLSRELDVIQHKSRPMVSMDFDASP